MAADTRTYIRIHDGMPDHPKVDGLSDRAFRLLVETWCWCSRHLTDGRIPDATWKKRGTVGSRAELLAAGLAEIGPDGTVSMHDYLEHQRSADEVAAMREQRIAAGRKGGKAKAARLANAKHLATDESPESGHGMVTATEVTRVDSRGTRIESSDPYEGSETPSSQVSDLRPLASAKRPAKQVAKQTASKSVASTETETEVPPVGDGEPSEANAGKLVAEWLQGCKERPPGRVVGHVAREVKVMLDEGINEERVRSGLAVWHSKNLHPSTLPSVVHGQQAKADKPDPDAWMRRTL